jgi:hypothetical protein
VDIDTSDADRLALDLNRESVLVLRRTNAAVAAGIDDVHAQAVATAEQFRDTGDMIAATRKVGSGYSRIVRCYDPAGLMNEYGSHGRAPRPWLLVHADAGAQIVETQLARGLDEFIR